MRRTPFGVEDGEDGVDGGAVGEEEMAREEVPLVEVEEVLLVVVVVSEVGIKEAEAQAAVAVALVVVALLEVANQEEEAQVAVVVSEVGIKVVALEVEKEALPFLVVLEEEGPVEIEVLPIGSRFDF